jgi:integrase
MANVRVYVRKKIDGKRNYYPAPHVPDLTACYYLRYEGHGKQTWKRVGHYDLVAKAKLCLERQLFAEANGYLLPMEERVSEAPPRPTLAQTIESYLEMQSTRRIRGIPLSTKTVQASRNVLGHFSKFCKKKLFDDVDRNDLERFMETISLRYTSDWTVHNYMINVLAFMRAAGRPGLMKNSEIPDPQTDPTKVKAYHENQIRRLFAAADDGELVWLNFFLYSACREQEVARLTWDRILWEDYALSIPNNRNFRTKSRRARLVPLEDTLVEMLKVFKGDKPDSALIFPAEKGGTEGHFLRKIQEIAHRAGLACGKCVPHDEEGNEVHDGRTCGNGKIGCCEYGCHCFRKTCATNWHRKGVPLGDIQAYLGHSSLEITRDYLQVSSLNDPAVRERINASRIK